MANSPPEAVPSLSLRILNSLRTFSHRASIVVIGIGLVVLLGWALDIDILTRIIPGRVTQKPNTALGLIVAGTALMLWHRQLNLPAGRLKRCLRLCLLVLSGIVLALGLETIIEYGFGLSFGLDQLLVGTPSDGVDGSVGGRPAPNTAVNFGLMGLALLLLTRQHYRAAQGLSVAAFLIALLALTGHLYAVTGFYSVGSVTGMAIHTAIAFLLLSLGVLCAQADRGWIREISTDHIGSIMIRQLLPILVALPILLGYAVLLIYKQLSLLPEEAIALRSILSVVMFVAVVLWNGRSLNRLDARRLWLQQRFNHELESQVATRTAELNAANLSLEHEVDRRQQVEADLRQSQSSLRQQLAEIETIYQSAPIGLNVLDPDLRFVRINERLAEMNGLSIEAHMGRTVRELLPDLADTAEQLLLPIFKTGEPILNIEVKGETPAQPGVQRIWLESFLPLKDGDRVVGISTVCEEVTERRAVEANLVNRAAQQAAVAQIGQQALASNDIDVFLDDVTARVAQVLNVEYCKVLKRLPEDRGFLLRSGVGWQDGLVGKA
ncbi:MAG: PAS domain-containing protein, partial [Elainellaceae cyanobacterium]